MKFKIETDEIKEFLKKLEENQKVGNKIITDYMANAVIVFEDGGKLYKRNLKTGEIKEIRKE